MSDPLGSKKPSIPEWQKGTIPPPPSGEQKRSPVGPPPAPRSTLLEQASQFLEDESIRDASTDRKISFLKSKGLQDEEIRQLLGVSRNHEATSTPEEPPTETSEPKESSAPETASPSPSSLHPSQPSPKTRDSPPIITYPEFIFRAQKPPPLLTFRRLIYLLYVTGGLTALMYGTSKYLVAPLLEALATSRHEFFTNAHLNLLTLNEKLSANVSKLPSQSAIKEQLDQQQQKDTDLESVTSDPTELFHRDIATQTTPTLLRSPTSISSSSSSSMSSTPSTPLITDKATTQATRLSNLHTQLRSLLQDETRSSDTLKPQHDQMAELQMYLDNLQFGGGSATSTYNNFDDGGKKDEKEDEVSRFKAEIRGVKGALLSAKNFPVAR